MEEEGEQSVHQHRGNFPPTARAHLLERLLARVGRAALALERVAQLRHRLGQRRRARLGLLRALRGALLRRLARARLGRALLGARGREVRVGAPLRRRELLARRLGRRREVALRRGARAPLRLELRALRGERRREALLLGGLLARGRAQALGLALELQDALAQLLALRHELRREVLLGAQRGVGGGAAARRGFERVALLLQRERLCLVWWLVGVVGWRVLLSREQRRRGSEKTAHRRKPDTTK